MCISHAAALPPLNPHVKVARKSDTTKVFKILRFNILLGVCFPLYRNSSPVLNQQFKQFAYFNVFRAPQELIHNVYHPFPQYRSPRSWSFLQVRLNRSNFL